MVRVVLRQGGKRERIVRTIVLETHWTHTSYRPSADARNSRSDLMGRYCSSQKTSGNLRLITEHKNVESRYRRKIGGSLPVRAPNDLPRKSWPLQLYPVKVSYQHKTFYR